MVSHLVYAAAGSNLGDSTATLKQAVVILGAEEGIEVTRASPVYSNPPVGPQDQPPFLNTVLELRTSLDARGLLDVFLTTELTFGRVRIEKWGPRTLDLDILFFGDEVIQEPGLTVPHPLAHERAFVLKPICDLNPHLVHPTAKCTVADLLTTVDDSSMRPVHGIVLVEAK